MAATESGKAMKFFGKKEGQSLSDFAKEWKELTDVDKRQIIDGVNDGSFTY